MIRHPYTLSHCAREFSDLLKSSTIVECYVKDQSTLVVCCDGDAYSRDIEFTYDEPYVGAFVRDHQGRPRKETRDVFPLALSAKVSSIVMPSADRVLCIVTNRVLIYLQFFSGGKATAILTNTEDYVVDALHHKEKIIARPIAQPTFQLRPLREMDASLSIHRALSHCDMQCGQYYASEICYRMQVDPKLTIESLTEETMQLLNNEGEKLRQACLKNAAPAILSNEKNASVLSLCELRDFPLTLKSYSSVNEAVMWRVIQMFRERRHQKIYDRVRLRVERECKRLEKALVPMREHMDNDHKAQTFKYFADILLSQLDVHSSGTNILETIGWNDETLHIPLDPRLNKAENAALYYDKVRRSREAIRISRIRVPQFERKLEELRLTLDRLSPELDVHELLLIEEKLAGRKMKSNESDQRSNASAYRVFVLDNGFTLYVGRNSKNNDELTMRFAKQNDIWMHARGVSGSHAVLRAPDSSSPSKSVLEQAASIAAYYSKARNAKYTPVVYTQRKNVRKPKGAAVGAVVLEREIVIMVEPRLPKGAVDEDEKV